MEGRQPEQFNFDERKFKDLLLYVAEQLGDDPTFGETKLNKILFFSDFEAYKMLGRPITGAEYQKNKFGPTARLYTVMRDELIRWNQLRVERKMVVDHVQDVVRPHEIKPNLAQFSEAELKIVDAVIEEMRQYTNTEASDESHKRSAGWLARDLEETIPYSSALINPEPLDDALIAGLKTKVPV
jgi:antitoxin SocA-like protein